MVKRKCAFLLAALLIFSLAPAPALAGENNVAVAVNVKDGSALFELSYTVLRVHGDEVMPMNFAVAVGSCSDCTTVAIAVQVVLVEDDPATIAPWNGAIAMNVDCFECVTAALAYQLVSSVPDSFKFTKDTKEEVKDLRDAFQALIEGDVPIGELLAAADVLARELFALVQAEIESGGKITGSDKADAIAGDDGAVTDGDATTSPSPEPSSSSASDDSPSPEPSPSDDGSASPEPEPSPSSSP